MANKKLIGVEDIKRYRPVTTDKDRLDIFIDEAQLNDLRPVLTDALYYDLMNKIDNTGDAMYTAYQELLRGKSYTYQGIQYVHDGIIPVLSYYALARLRANPMEDTRFGTHMKLNERSAQVTPEVLTSGIDSLTSIALSYQERLIDFLNRNSSTYPLWSNGSSETLNNNGTKFFDPDAANPNNYNSYGNNANGRTI